MLIYEELEHLFSCLSKQERDRVIYRFILELSAKQIAIIENRSRGAIHMTLNNVEKKLKRIRDKADLVAVLEEIYKCPD
jgi:DNA-directed RNA polymerase specialized sigma24 family protein